MLASLKIGRIFSRSAFVRPAQAIVIGS